MEREIDLSIIGVRFTRLLRDNGLRYAPERAGTFIRAMVLLEPATVGELYWCARTTLVSSHHEIELFDFTFQYLFGGEQPGRVDQTSKNPLNIKMRIPEAAEDRAIEATKAKGTGEMLVAGESNASQETGSSNLSITPTIASDAEELRSKSFAELSESELATLMTLMASMVHMIPSRLSNRTEPVNSRGDRIDLRSSLRRSRASGGEMTFLVHRKYKTKSRRVVALLDISESMENFTRPYLHFLHFLSRNTKVETFSFATQLTRLTKEMKQTNVNYSANLIGFAANDWSSGTKIGTTLEIFIDNYGRRGMARGAVILIFSDGWEHGDLSLLGQQMERLSRISHKIVWINPRKANAGYEPLVGGMSVALPFCDSFVSGVNFDALEEILNAMSE